ncbi:DUF521 domain-containing protein [Siculibacillus lacustris]|uniref:DUF521 domain-containing protein n=1 Tax=Siculibacillus lacustris TaxID=1549641 RepID=A0A4Q9VPF6_9HYPH|nr:aconitase family protein [Siculibacillus lacustris]TBW36792.1 DUF521 domain-containing protein [Siculibacillus lacustris]
MSLSIPARTLAGAGAAGPLLTASEGLSFWGGVDPETGNVIDRHHPLAGACVTGRVLAIPSGRGSCTGSGVLMEMILAGRAPAAIVVCEAEEILTLGALVAELVFDRSLAVVQIARDDFARLAGFAQARIEDGRLIVTAADGEDATDAPVASTAEPAAADGAEREVAAALRLSPLDRAFLDGRHGRAAQVAFEIIRRMAAIQGARELIDVTRVHVDGCIYTGRAGLRFAELLVEWGARVRVPTTLNAISVDRRRWASQGVAPALGVPASALADAYVAMGAEPSFTCAPYLLDDAPVFGEQIGWAESNAVVYANSVIGARTMKVPDYLDICIALTGRAPAAGCHLDAGRRATVALDVVRPEAADDAFWPLAGYACGLVAGADIPVIFGLEAAAPTADDLKAFCAAFGTTSAAPMLHIAGVTPEAAGQDATRRIAVGVADLRRAWDELNGAATDEIGLVSLGNPHFSLAECAALAHAVAGRTRSPEVAVVVTCGRAVHDAATRAGHVAAAERFGVAFVTDTCWCMLGEPIVPPTARNLMTNSGKYAHYAPGLVERGVRFGSLGACIDAAVTGRASARHPAWLAP